MSRSRGLQSAFQNRRSAPDPSLPIITQGFNPGRPWEALCVGRLHPWQALCTNSPHPQACPPPLALSPKRIILVPKSPGNMAKEKKITTVNNDGHIVALENALIRQDEHIILRDVNYQVRPGEFLYLIGRVGSGKSSLLKTLYAEIPLREGTGFAAGYQLNKLKTKDVPVLRRRMGIVFQDFQLLIDRNVYDNLLFVLRATGWKNQTDRKSVV